MKLFGRFACGFLACMVGGSALGDVFHDYENFEEGFIGESFSQTGVTYRDANRVSGRFPAGGEEFGPDDLGSNFIIEQANLWYDAFPEYGSRSNSLTFGRAFVPGDNLSLGPLASIWMDLDEMSTEVSLDIGFLENGPWGGIEYRLEALSGDTVVGSDSFIISDRGGRDNGAFRTMSISGVEFDRIHLYGWLNDAYTAPRGIIDDLSIIAVPEPTSLLLIGAGGIALLRRRR